ncbi:MAG TPA: hypothetical protein VGD65_21750 [Chryseosolibacter sp.]
MKHFSFIQILLLILMLVVYHCSHAQEYVVPLRGDTIRGDVRPAGIGLTQRVQVVGQDGKKKSFGVVEVREFKFKDEIYRPVKGVNGYVFMKLIKDGYLGLYGFQPDNQTNYDGRFLMRRDGSGIEVPNLTFKKSITKFLSDCPTVADKVEKGDLGRREIETIVTEYNNCINKNTNEVAVETKKLDPLDVLEQKVKAKPTFEGQNDALDMIAEMKKKVQRKEKVPNFMVEGLKNALSSQTDLTTDLDAALKELAN